MLLLPVHSKADDAYIWTFDYKKGTSERFRTHIKITGKTADGTGDIDITTMSVSKHTYIDVAPDGAATYEQLDEKSEVKFNGTALPDKPDERKPVTLIRGKNGVYLKRSTPGADLATTFREKSLLALMSLPVPEKPVKIGESWTSVIPNAMLRNKTITATSTLVGIEKILGRDALKISLKMEFPVALNPRENEVVALEETYYLDAATHVLLRARYTIKNPVLPFQTSKAEALVFVTQVLPGVNETEGPEEESSVGVEKPKS
jgi:hypothetical protein